MLKIKAFFDLNFFNFNSILTFNVNTSKIVCIIGESGSGKSTLLRCISGLEHPLNSYLILNGIVLQNSKKNVFVKSYNRRIGYVFQNPYLYENMSVFENIIFANRSFSNADVLNLINFLNLNKIKKRSVQNLSGGEKQRVAIAQVLLSNPNLLLLDEIFSNQDLYMKERLIFFFRKINFDKKIPIIYVSHDIKNIDKFSDYIIYLNKGKIIV